MSPSLTAFAYLISGVLFVLALRGLSNPTSSRQGNLFGMIGMAIAILATLARSGMSPSGYVLIILAIIIGGGIGVTVSRRIQMTSLPQLVAAFHSLVGLAAVFVAAAAINAPAAFGIGVPGHIHGQSLVEMSIGLAIGAVTFTGSLIAFAKLQALDEGNADHLQIPAPAECVCWAFCWCCWSSCSASPQARRYSGSSHWWRWRLASC